MQSGKLRKRFTIQYYASENLNDYGENVPNWTTFATRWGSLDAFGGNERELAEKVTADVTHKIRIRYTDNLTPAMRFKLGDRYFEIRRILADRTDEKFQLILVEEKLD